MALGTTERQPDLGWSHFQIALQQQLPPKTRLRRTWVAERSRAQTGPRRYTKQIGIARAARVLIRREAFGNESIDRYRIALLHPRPGARRRRVAARGAGVFVALGR